MLHRIFQKHDIMPHEFYQLEERYKTFIYASELIEKDKEDEEAKRLEKENQRRERTRGRGYKHGY